MPFFINNFNIIFPKQFKKEFYLFLKTDSNRRNYKKKQNALKKI